MISFFFSSRRRHTRFDCDWSSDVCSSDLIAEQVIVEKVEMPPGQPADLRQRRIHLLGVEAAPAFEKRVLVAERAMVRAAARNHDRIRHEVAVALDEIAANRR